MKLPKLISLEEVRTAMEPDADTLKAVADDLERKAAHDREQLEEARNRQKVWAWFNADPIPTNKASTHHQHQTSNPSSRRILLPLASHSLAPPVHQGPHGETRPQTFTHRGCHHGHVREPARNS